MRMTITPVMISLPQIDSRIGNRLAVLIKDPTYAVYLRRLRDIAATRNLGQIKIDIFLRLQRIKGPLNFARGHWQILLRR